MRIVRACAVVSTAFAFILFSIGASHAAGDTWTVLARTPAGIGSGATGRLTAAYGTDTIFQLRGGGTNTFYAYRISTDTWVTTMASTPTVINFGATLLFPGVGDTLYANRGGGTNTFHRYSVTRNAWEAAPSLPATAGDGSAMCMAGTDTIFASVGGNANFYRFVISQDTWQAMTSAPGAFNNGASMTYAGVGDFIYVLQGGGTTFYRYSISANSWTILTSYPQAVSFGSSLVFGPDGYLYGARGGNNRDFWRYSVTTDSWTPRLANTPGNFSDGSGLTYVAGGQFLYAVCGGGRDTFARYQFQSTPDTPSSFLQAKLDSTVIAIGGSFRDTTSILFRVQAGDPSDTVRIQIELRKVDVAFTSPVDAVIDNVIFFQSAFSSTAVPETLAITANGLSKGSYHWQVRVVDARGDSTGWTRVGNNTENPPTNPAAADFIVDSTASGTFPASLRVGDSVSAIIADTDRNTNAGATETVSVTVTNNRTGETETLVLTEQSANSSQFGISTDTLPLSINTADNASSSGRLFALAGDTIRISYVDGTDSSSSAQSGNITVSHDSVFSAGTFPASLRVGDSASAIIRDTDQNFSGIRVETVTVTVTNNRTGETETRTLIENGANAGYFGVNETVALSSSAADSVSGSGRLFALAGDTVSIRYLDPTDATDSSSSGNLTVSHDTVASVGGIL